MSNVGAKQTKPDFRSVTYTEALDTTVQPATLRRELSLRDLTLFSIACIVGTRWVPSAAHAGPGSITLWLLAAVLFAAPLAIAVASLSAKYPGAGGMYLWARGDFGQWHGFLCFWVYWMGIVIWFPSAAMFYMSVAISALGPQYAALANRPAYLLPAALVAIWLALGTNLVGMKIGKWTENAGAIATWILGVLLAVLACAAWMKRGTATHLDIAPHWNWDTVNYWAAIAYALSGLEVLGLMGGEIRNPARDIPRAGWLSSAAATLLYCVMTAAMLVLLRPEKISELSGMAQAGDEAGSLLHMPWLTPVIAFLVLASAVGQFGGLGSAASRLPFAAGVDHLLPPAFSKIHPRWATPHISILTLGVLASLLLVAVQLGDTMSAAYQALVSLVVIAGFLPYLYIFSGAWKAGKRVSAASGLTVTLLAIICSVVPTAEVNRVWVFEAKLAAGTLLVIASAWLIYQKRGQKRGAA